MSWTVLFELDLAFDFLFVLACPIDLPSGLVFDLYKLVLFVGHSIRFMCRNTIAYIMEIRNPSFGVGYKGCV